LQHELSLLESGDFISITTVRTGTISTTVNAVYSGGSSGSLTVAASTGAGDSITSIALLDRTASGIELTTHSNTWTFGADGSLTFPDGGTLRIKGNPPNTSKGVAGDKAGMIAFGTGFIYHCYNDYTDGTGDIWGRVTIDNTSF
jgi:hypothetical protein